MSKIICPLGILVFSCFASAGVLTSAQPTLEQNLSDSQIAFRGRVKTQTKFEDSGADSYRIEFAVIRTLKGSPPKSIVVLHRHPNMFAPFGAEAIPDSECLVLLNEKNEVLGSGVGSVCVRKEEMAAKASIQTENLQKLEEQIKGSVIVAVSVPDSDQLKISPYLSVHPLKVRIVGPAKLVKLSKEIWSKWVGCGHIIDWGDGTADGDEHDCSMRLEHTYKSPGSYKVKASILKVNPDDSRSTDWSGETKITVK